MQCLRGLSEDEPGFATLFATASHEWYRRIADSVVRRFPEAAPERPTIELAVYAVGGMIDDLTRKLFAIRVPEVVRLVAAVAPSDDALTHFLSVPWYRALHGSDPVDQPRRVVAPKLAGAAKGARGGPPAPGR